MESVTVVGAGAMGAGIAQAFAKAGRAVVLQDVSEAALSQAMQKTEAALDRRVEAGKMDAGDAQTLLDRIRTEPDLAAATADAELVVEAVFEDLAVKRDVFRRLGDATRPETVLATNTSSFRVAELAQATAHPERVVGLHYFFPPAANRLVEVVHTPGSRPAADRAYAEMKAIGKVPVRTADAHGFCVNRFLVPFVNEGFRLWQERVASPAAIEAAGKEAFGSPFGPFGVFNLSGPVVTTHAQETLHRAFGRFYEPCASMLDHADRNAPVDLEGPAEGSREKAVRRLRGVVYGIACHLTESGVASEADTDLAACTGLRWTRGPFETMAGDAEAAEAMRRLHGVWGDAFPMPTRFG